MVVNIFSNLNTLMLNVVRSLCISCLTQTGSTTVISGTQTSQYDNTGLAANTILDTRLAEWRIHTVIPAQFSSAEPIRIGAIGAGHLCWYGGTAFSDAPPDSPYDGGIHDTYGMLIQPNSGGDNTNIQYF